MNEWTALTERALMWDDDGNEYTYRPQVDAAYVTWTADKDYLRGTHYDVTTATEANADRVPHGNPESVPPCGLMCSARLGKISTLL